MATMKDVAREAGVSVGTVSAVVNNIKVKPKSKEKVEAAIKKLNYVPNEAGRALKTSVSKNIVFIVPNISHIFFSELVYYIEEELDKHDYKLLLCNSRGDLEKELRFIELLKTGKVSGVIIITDSKLSEHITPEMPVVTFDREISDFVQCITSDNYEGGALAADMLVKTGCKNIQYIGSERPHFFSYVGDRVTGFTQKAQALGVPHHEYMMPYGVNDLRSYVKDMFDKSEGFDGVFTENDILALNVIQEAQSRNIKIPEELSVIGFDGNTISEGLHPVLSTVVQDKPELAKAVVEQLFNKIENDDHSNDVVKVPVGFRMGETIRRVEG